MESPLCTVVEGDVFLSTVLGGMLMGLGLGIVLVTGASSGGVDMISVLVNRKKTRLSVMNMMIVIMLEIGIWVGYLVVPMIQKDV